MPEISRGRALAYAVVLLVVLVVGGRMATGRGGPDAPAAAQAPAALESEAQEPRPLVVHVVGAVEQPGLYRVPEGSRVNDAIRRAGGARPKAALELVNLAAPVADGQQVVVPVRDASAGASAPGGVAEGGTAADGAPSTGAAPGGRVHLNSATAEQLDALPGVGPVTAQKIIDYRTEQGAFSSVDELDAVPGIGPARLAELRELVDL